MLLKTKLLRLSAAFAGHTADGHAGWDIQQSGHLEGLWVLLKIFNAFESEADVGDAAGTAKFAFLQSLGDGVEF